MKKACFLLVIFIVAIIGSAFSQKIIRTESTDGTTQFKIDASNSNLAEFIRPNDLRTRGVRKTIPFMEFGDGAFSTESETSHQMGNQKYSTLVFAAPIYDTTKPYLTKLAFKARSGSTSGANSTNKVAVIPVDKRIHITCNVNEIVPGDHNNFAITYRLPETGAVPKKYRVLFFYNSNAVFSPIKATKILEGDVPMVRLFYDDKVVTADNRSLLVSVDNDSKVKYNNSLAIECGSFDLVDNGIDSGAKRFIGTEVERNIFISTFTEMTAELNNVTSLYAVLQESADQGDSWTKVDDYFINSMPVAEAHDPNYIRQTGQCILLPKDKKLVKYHVHFQNDGEGQAGQVDVHVKLPKGINNKNVKFGTANCGGNPFVFSSANTTYNEETYTLSFEFKKGELPYLLKGTLENVNPFQNPNTMGDIFFSVEESVITTDTLPAVAHIDFYNINSSKPLPSVSTNLAVSVYKLACDGGGMNIQVDTAAYWKPAPCVNCPNCTTFLKICWYWWLLLIPVFIGIYWLYKKQSKKKDNKNDAY